MSSAPRAIVPDTNVYLAYSCVRHLEPQRPEAEVVFGNAGYDLYATTELLAELERKARRLEVIYTHLLRYLEVHGNLAGFSTPGMSDRERRRVTDLGFQISLPEDLALLRMDLRRFRSRLSEARGRLKPDIIDEAPDESYVCSVHDAWSTIGQTDARILSQYFGWGAKRSSASTFLTWDKRIFKRRRRLASMFTRLRSIDLSLCSITDDV